MANPSEFSPERSAYKDKLIKLETVCRELTAQGKDRDEGFLVVPYFTDSGAVMIATYDAPSKMGQTLHIDFYHNPLRDEDGIWFLPVTAYNLTADRNLSSYPDKEKDSSMVKGLMDLRARELIDFPPEAANPEPVEPHGEITDDKWDLIYELAKEHNAPREAAEELGATSVSEQELDDVLKKLGEIQANPKVIDFSKK